jgi:hypothetical protein
MNYKKGVVWSSIRSTMFITIHYSKIIVSPCGILEIAGVEPAPSLYAKEVYLPIIRYPLF